MNFVNELEVFKQIVADLSGVSVWLMALYVLTKAMAIAAWVYLGDRVIRAVVSILKADVSKEDYRKIDDDNHRLKREIEDAKSCAQREIEGIKHKYKILKEAQQHKDAAE